MRRQFRAHPYLKVFWVRVPFVILTERRDGSRRTSYATGCRVFHHQKTGFEYRHRCVYHYPVPFHIEHQFFWKIILCARNQRLCFLQQHIHPAWFSRTLPKANVIMALSKVSCIKSCTVSRLSKSGSSVNTATIFPDSWAKRWSAILLISACFAGFKKNTCGVNISTVQFCS